MARIGKKRKAKPLVRKMTDGEVDLVNQQLLEIGFKTI